MTTSETNKESSRKRHRFFLKNEEEFSSEVEDTQTTATAISEIWDYFIKKTEKNNGHYEATCNDISRYWKEKIAKKDPNYTQRLKKNCTLPNSMPQTTMAFHYASD
ncbi:35235_t:CDS:2, partial [Racocetra persica]